MKFQIFVPPKGYIALRWSEGTSMPPLGILYLAAVLEKEGCEVDVVPADVLGFGWQDIENRFIDFQPDIVGVTTTSENRFDSFNLLKRVKGINPEIITVLGGPHISMAGKETLQFIKEADVLVIGEGEETILELVRTIESRSSLSEVKGIFYRNDKGEVIYTGIRERIEPLDILPFPARHLIPMDKYNFHVDTKEGRKKAQNIITSRGCPFKCYFCATPLNWGRRVRGHSPKRVLKEIEHVIDRYGAEFIWFYDDTFNYNQERIVEIMNMIIERKLNIRFSSEFRIDIIDKPTLEKMREAGLERGYFGIEAGSSRIRNDIVGKKFDIGKAYRFVKWAKELDFVPGPFFIFSHYTETWSESQKTIEIMENLQSIYPEMDISTAILHVYPGTSLEAIAKQEGIMPNDFLWSKKKYMNKVYTLPASQGYVPLFKDKLSWWQISDLVMRWSSNSKKSFSISKLRKTVESWKSIKIFFINFVFLVNFIKHKIKKLHN